MIFSVMPEPVSSKKVPHNPVSRVLGVDKGIIIPKLVQRRNPESGAVGDHEEQHPDISSYSNLAGLAPGGGSILRRVRGVGPRDRHRRRPDRVAVMPRKLGRLGWAAAAYSSLLFLAAVVLGALRWSDYSQYEGARITWQKMQADAAELSRLGWEHFARTNPTTGQRLRDRLAEFQSRLDAAKARARR
jgi:hypothetical protein